MSRNFSRCLMVTALFLMMASILYAKSNKDSNQAWLGVKTQSVDYDLAEAFDLSVNYGAIVNSTFDDSPADEAGIQEGDIIVAINDSKVTDSDDLADFISDYIEGDKVDVVLIRDGSKKVVSVTLGERKVNRYSDKRRYKNKYDRRDNKNRFFGRLSPVPSVPSIPHVPSAPFVVFDNNNGNKCRWYSSGSYIGVTITSLTEQLGDFFGVEDGKGVLITEVLTDSPAEKAGLKAGDVVTGVDGEEIENSSDLQELISEYDQGDMVEISYVRNKKIKAVKVEIAENDSKGYRYSYFFNSDDDDDLKDLEFIWNEKKFNEHMKEFNKEIDGFNFKLKDFKKNEMRNLKREMNELKKELNREFKGFRKRD